MAMADTAGSRREFLQASRITVLLVISGFNVDVIGIRSLASHRLRRAKAWACGFDQPVPMAQYTASSFAQPVRRVFAKVLRAEEQVKCLSRAICGGAIPRLLARCKLGVHLRADRHDGRLAVADVNQLQFLTIRNYLSLMFFALIGLLFLVAVTQ